MERRDLSEKSMVDSPWSMDYKTVDCDWKEQECLGEER